MSANQSAAKFQPAVNKMVYIYISLITSMCAKRVNGALFFAPECRFPLSSCFVDFEELIVALKRVHYVGALQPYASRLICHAYLSTHNCSSRPVQINDLRFICDTAAKAVHIAPRLLYSPRRVMWYNNGHELCVPQSSTIMSLMSFKVVILGRPALRCLIWAHLNLNAD